MSKKPKLCLIPSGYKASKVYSVLPSDGVGDFDFTRLTIATRINKDGLIESVGNNVPRLNYPLIDGVVSGCPSLLLESTSTNLLTYSEDFSNAYWIKQSSSITSNQAISPDGTLNADLYTTSSATFDFIQTTYSFIVSGYSFSVFAKKGTSDKIDLSLSGTAFTDTRSVRFDLTNKTTETLAGILSSKIEEYPNGWFRCSIYAVTNSSGSGNVRLLSGSSDNVSTLYLWGAQLEQGYLTSYIPTISFTVTRSAETCNNSGDVNTFNDSEGVLMAEMAWINNDLDVNSDLSLSDNSASNRVLITQTTTKNQIEMFFRGTGATISQFFTLNDTSNFNKFAIKYKSTDFAFYINGFKLFESNSVATVSNLFDLSFDNPSGGGTRNFYGNTKQIQYFDTALNDSDLETLTSWTSFNEMAESQLYTIQ